MPTFLPPGDNYDPFARFYDLFYAQCDEDIPMYLDFARAADGAILELGCGSGRLLLPLAQAGHRVTGLDGSAEMLARARERLRAAGLAEYVTLAHGDLRHFELAERFALAILSVNTFMHCHDTQAQLACLGCVHRHLGSGGRLVVDLTHPDLPTLAEMDGRLLSDEPVRDPQTGYLVQRFIQQRLDWANQLQHVTFIIDELAPDGSVRRTLFPFHLRLVFRFEMELLLRLAGFGLEALYGSYHLEPFGSHSERMIFVARRD
ncbi:MAG: class I SAM-dependent methyltransferase [Anaerolineae bacterium]|nr:class I SAM-dependent methyltransferase [Anaerolineae bacterium]MDW8071174.1 class I SAM-dependent methyltransferase [Anaerolineae bacterium]